MERLINKQARQFYVIGRRKLLPEIWGDSFPQVACASCSPTTG